MFLEFLNVDVVCCADRVMFVNRGVRLSDGHDALFGHLTDDHRPLRHHLFRRDSLLSASLLVVRVEGLVVGLEPIGPLEVHSKIGWHEFARLCLEVDIKMWFSNLSYL